MRSWMRRTQHPCTRHPCTRHQHPSPITRSLLLPALQAAEAGVGWISEGALNHLCERLSVPPAEAYGVASFYDMFSMKPRPPSVVHVCDDIACRVNDAEALCRDLEQTIGKAGEPSAHGRTMWVRSPCLGPCDPAPARLVPNSGINPTHVTLTPSHGTRVYAEPARFLRPLGVAGPRRLDAFPADRGDLALA